MRQTWAVTDFVPDVPGSRSIAARALICAALAPGHSTVTNIPDCDDTNAILACVSATAARVELRGRVATVAGAHFAPTGAVMDCNASGTTMRFIVALSALTSEPMTLTGTTRLLQRPMEGLNAALAALGKTVAEQGSHRVITGTPSLPRELTVDASKSGQFVSGLLMALAATGSPVTVRALAPASRPFISMTVAIMRDFGADITQSADGEDVVFELAGTGYTATDFTVEPDVMSANYFLSAAAITGKPVVIPGLTRETVQGDVALLDVLAAMGATVEQREGRLRSSRDPAVALTGTTVDLSGMPDMSLTIGALAAVAQGPTTMTSARILQYKESDRLTAMTTELRKLGAQINVASDKDTVTVTPRLPLTPAAIDTYEDHRMAMAFGLLTLVEPRIVINDPECVTKTWPGFFAELERYSLYSA